MYAYIFPGQGSQSIGMGKEFYDNFSIAREVFHEVDDALSQHLSKMIFEGIDADLNLTVNTQPALMTVSLAIFHTLENEIGMNPLNHAVCVAGHSLGEYSALAAAGALSIRDTAYLLRTRGAAMQSAVPVGEGSMAALLGIELDQADRLVKEVAQDQVCCIANDNSPGQVVISGHTQAIQRAIEAAPAFGASRAIILTVSAPFHSPLMAPAARVMKNALDDVKMADPQVPLIANITAEEIHVAEQIKHSLVEQVTGKVRWRETIARFHNRGIQKVVEVGAGKVLTGLTKRIDSTLTSYAINKPNDMKEFLKNLI